MPTGIGQDVLGGAGSGAALGPWGAVAGGLLGLGVGLFQRGSANKWLRSHQQPIEQLPSEITQNQNLARQQAATGLPSEQYAKAMQNIQRQQMFALRTAQGRRAAIGALPAITQGTNDATLNLNATDAQMQLQNQRNLMNVNNQVAGWKSRLFQQNQLQPYMRDYQYRMGELGAGDVNAVGGADKLLAGLFGGNYGGGYGGGVFGGSTKRTTSNVGGDVYGSGGYGR